jgi:hypothetical protein
MPFGTLGTLLGCHRPLGPATIAASTAQLAQANAGRPFGLWCDVVPRGRRNILQASFTSQLGSRGASRATGSIVATPAAWVICGEAV